ncbi:uncharacterized protein LOC142326248 [Lycorma delicatula]|uniref:uncharacterized protein LOC142326248 n=1 Tax=Lycorma delicatula TaxID=130591 RepID=UPI003F50D9FB
MMVALIVNYIKEQNLLPELPSQVTNPQNSGVGGFRGQTSCTNRQECDQQQALQQQLRAIGITKQWFDLMVSLIVNYIKERNLLPELTSQVANQNNPGFGGFRQQQYQQQQYQPQQYQQQQYQPQQYQQQPPPYYGRPPSFTY